MNAPQPGTPVILITGASGGLGRALVAQFASQGWRVAAAYHTRNVHDDTSQVWPLQLDVTAPDQAQSVTEEILRRWHQIDLLVNNAGLTSDRLSWQIRDRDWDRVLAVSLTGAFICSRAVLPAMLRRQEGHIIHIGSLSGRSGRTGQAGYAAAKAGLLGFSAALAREVGPQNVRVNTILPGLLRSPMTDQLHPRRLGQLLDENVLGRFTDPLDVARFTFCLASLRDVSGQCFQLDSRITPWS